MTNKLFFILMLTFFLSNKISAQDTLKSQGKFKIEVGYIYLNNKLNADKYYDFKHIYGIKNNESKIGGINVKLSKTTKYDFIDLMVGALFINGLDKIDNNHINLNSDNAHDYKINGGGVYWGISPKLKGKIVGITSDFGIGVFSFKEYVSIINNTEAQTTYDHNLKASYGLGAISSIGLSLNIGKIGINPSITAIFSGGAQSSFTFYGVNFPLTYQF
ncbi:hypothetical protein EMN47_01015 [Prolixibacteraceae bacterium JC049]|nr:hypothetical protein [Prolixibacteraceae bacterium JC049]